MELVSPTAEYKDSFMEAIREFRDGNDTNERRIRYAEYAQDIEAHGFDAFIQNEEARARGENLPEGYVPETSWWLVDNKEFIGRVSIRHRLNDHLMQIGGHIGYDIRPSKRMKGYGTDILRLAIPKAHELGIDHILVTCDTANVASRKIIEKNGGILENHLKDPAKGIDKLRFWISLQK